MVFSPSRGGYTLRSVADYKCGGLPAESVVTDESFEVVTKFYYLGDMITACGGVEESIG